MVLKRRMWVLRHFGISLLVLHVLLMTSCNGTDKTAEEQQKLAEEQQKAVVADSVRKADSVLQARAEQAIHRFSEIRYEILPLRTAKQLDSVKKLFKVGVSADTAKILALLNRKQLGYIRVGDSVVLPNVINKDLRAYSIFPQFYAGAASIPKIIMISNKYQAYACYEYGDLKRYVACNTGTKGKPTFPGRYAVNWKQAMRISSLNEEWKLPWTVNFHLYAGSAFHQFDMPGRPVSHSCVRQFMDDAKWLFSWVKVAKIDSSHRFVPFTGTPVIILDMFDYNRKRGGPWLDVHSNKESLVSLPEKPMEVEEALIPMSQVPKDARGALPNRKRYLYAQDTLIARGVIDSTFRLRESIDYNKLRAAKAAAKKKDTEKKPVEATKPNGTQ